MKAWMIGFGLAAMAVTAPALPVLDWVHQYADAPALRCADARRTADGGLVLAGSCRAPGQTHTQHCVLRLDSAGQRLWFRTYGEPATDERAFAVGQTSDSGYLVAGVRVGFGLELLRLDADGGLLWAQFHRFQGLIVPSDLLHAVVTLDDGLVVAGGIDTNAGDARLLRFDFRGDLLWARSYGGAAYDCALGLARLPDGGFLVPG